MVGCEPAGISATTRRLRGESEEGEAPAERLAETTERLENAEARIEQLEEKLRFVERLVASRPARPELGPPDSIT